VKSDLGRNELLKKFSVTDKRHAKQGDKEAEKEARHARTPRAANLMDNVSNSSAKESIDSDKFIIPNASKIKPGVRSVNRMQLEDNDDSVKSGSNDSSFHRYSQTSSRIGIES
jgi:hypothetical protein